MQAKPDFRPSESARPTNKVMSGPGVMAMMMTATANWRMVEKSGRKDMDHPLPGRNTAGWVPAARTDADQGVTMLPFSSSATNSDDRSS